MARARAWRLALILLIVVGAAAAAVVVVRVLDREDCEPLPKEGPGVSRVDLGATALDVAAGPKGLWAVRLIYGPKRQVELVELDPATRRIKGKPVELPDFSGGLTVSHNAVWVASFTTERPRRGALLRVDPSSHRIISRLAIGRPATSVSVGAGGIWVASPDADTVLQLDATGSRILKRIHVEAPERVFSSAGAVWVGAADGSTSVHRIDAATGKVTADVDGSLQNVSPDAIWVILNGPPNGQVARLNPVTSRSDSPTLPLDISPSVMGVAGRDVWVGTYFTFCIPGNPEHIGLPPTLVGWFRIDPETLRPISGPVFLRSRVRTPAYAAGAFWIATYETNEVIRIDLRTASKVRPPAKVPALR